MKLAEEMCELAKHAEENAKMDALRRIKDSIRASARLGGTLLLFTTYYDRVVDEWGILDCVPFHRKYTDYVLSELSKEGFTVVKEVVPEKVIKPIGERSWFYKHNVPDDIKIPGYTKIKISWCCNEK